jgi:hypothetical protein
MARSGRKIAAAQGCAVTGGSPPAQESPHGDSNGDRAHNNSPGERDFYGIHAAPPHISVRGENSETPVLPGRHISLFHQGSEAFVRRCSSSARSRHCRAAWMSAALTTWSLSCSASSSQLCAFSKYSVALEPNSSPAPGGLSPQNKDETPGERCICQHNCC